MENYGIVIDMSTLSPNLYNQELYDWFIRKTLKEQFPFINLENKSFPDETVFNKLYLENINQFLVIENRIFDMLASLGIHIPDRGKIMTRDDYVIIFLGEKTW